MYFGILSYTILGEYMSVITEFEVVWELQVFRTDFWMMQWGAECPKRSTLWSNHGDIIAKMVWVPAQPNLKTTCRHPVCTYPLKL